MKTKEKVVDFLSKYFKELRFGVDNHLGLGDIRLTFMEYHITGLSDILNHLKEKLPSELYLEIQKFYFRAI